MKELMNDQSVGFLDVQSHTQYILSSCDVGNKKEGQNTVVDSEARNNIPISSRCSHRRQRDGIDCFSSGIEIETKRHWR